MTESAKHAAGGLYTELNNLCIGITSTSAQLLESILNDSESKIIETLINGWSSRALALHKFIVGYQTPCINEKNQLLIRSSVVSNCVIKSIQTIRELINTKPPTIASTCQSIKSELASAIKGVGVAGTALAKAVASSSLTPQQQPPPTTTTNPINTPSPRNPRISQNIGAYQYQYSASPSRDSFVPQLVNSNNSPSSGSPSSFAPPEHVNVPPGQTNHILGRSSVTVASGSLEMCNKCLDLLYEIFTSGNEKDVDRFLQGTREYDFFVFLLLLFFFFF